MAIDLTTGISLKIEGELGKYQTLPIESLVKIAESLQSLVLSIAKYDLPANETIDLNNFKLELTDFQKGSAIPSFVLTNRIQPVVAGNFETQRNEVTKRLNRIFSISDKGDYSQLEDLYPEPYKRNEIVENLYGFTSSFNNSPVFIFEKGSNHKVDLNYRPKRFKPAIKKSLLVDIKQVKEEGTEEHAFARIRVTKKGGRTKNRIEHVIPRTRHSLSYSPDIINVNGRQYTLHFPLRCLFEKEEDFYVINNEQIDIIGTGETQDDAEQNFNEEFDFLYLRLNSLGDNQLNSRLLRIKKVLNSFVKNVT